MSFREASLKELVHKWLGDERDTAPKVTDFSHTRHKPWRYVCVKATRATGTISFIFFRYDDGSWGLFPPDQRRVTLQHPNLDR
jgi:hypothetical protein